MFVVSIVSSELEVESGKEDDLRRRAVGGDRVGGRRLGASTIAKFLASILLLLLASTTSEKNCKQRDENQALVILYIHLY